MLCLFVVALGAAVVGVLVYILAHKVIYLYHRFRFGYAKELLPLASHPYAQRLSKLDDLDLAKKQYACIPRDGNCGYHSIIYCIYEHLVQTSSTIHRLFLDQRNFHHLKNAGDTAGLRRRIQDILARRRTYAQLTYAEAGDLSRWLKLLVAAHILEREGQYAGFIAPDNTTVKAYVKELLSTRRNFWMDFPIGKCVT